MKRLSEPKHDLINNQNVVQNLDTAWVSDYTFIDRARILLITDLSTRQIVSYSVSLKPIGQKEHKHVNDTDQLINCLGLGILDRQAPAVFHSDQGGTYVSNAFGEYLASQGIKQSFTCNKYDKFRNQVAERLNRTVKSILRPKLVAKFSLEGKKAQQAINFLSKTDDEQAKQWINEAIEHYNDTPHKHLKGSSPNTTESALLLREKPIYTRNINEVVSKSSETIIAKDIEVLKLIMGKNGSKRAEHIEKLKQKAIARYNGNWEGFATALLEQHEQSVILAEERHQETLVAVEESKDYVVNQVKSKSFGKNKNKKISGKKGEFSGKNQVISGLI